MLVICLTGIEIVVVSSPHQSPRFRSSSSIMLNVLANGYLYAIYIYSRVVNVTP